MSTEFQTPEEYERQQRLFAAKARGTAESEAERVYRAALELRTEILSVIKTNVLSLSDFDLKELENLAAQIEGAISSETLEDLERGQR